MMTAAQGTRSSAKLNSIIRTVAVAYQDWQGRFTIGGEAKVNCRWNKPSLVFFISSNLVMTLQHNSFTFNIKLKHRTLS